MNTVTLLLLATMVTAACAAGQYYVPRSYYVIDAAGHESPPVAVRRLRRSVLDPLPYRHLAHDESAALRPAASGRGRRVLSALGGWTVAADEHDARKP